MRWHWLIIVHYQSLRFEKCLLVHLSVDQLGFHLKWNRLWWRVLLQALSQFEDIRVWLAILARIVLNILLHKLKRFHLNLIYWFLLAWGGSDWWLNQFLWRLFFLGRWLLLFHNWRVFLGFAWWLFHHGRVLVRILVSGHGGRLEQSDWSGNWILLPERRSLVVFVSILVFHRWWWLAGRPPQSFDGRLLYWAVWLFTLQDFLWTLNNLVFCRLIHRFTWRILFCLCWFTHQWILRCILWTGVEVVIDASCVDVFIAVVALRGLIHNFSPGSRLIHIGVFLFSDCLFTVHLHINSSLLYYWLLRRLSPDCFNGGDAASSFDLDGFFFFRFTSIWWFWGDYLPTTSTFTRWGQFDDSLLSFCWHTDHFGVSSFLLSWGWLFTLWLEWWNGSLRRRDLFGWSLLFSGLRRLSGAFFGWRSFYQFLKFGLFVSQRDFGFGFRFALLFYFIWRWQQFSWLSWASAFSACELGLTFGFGFGPGWLWFLGLWFLGSGSASLSLNFSSRFRCWLKFAQSW